MQSYAEYMTQGGFVDSTFRGSYNRTTVYCGVAQKPLHALRRRFVTLVATFLAVQLVVSIGLVVWVAVWAKSGKSSIFVKRRDCVACDHWCAANCSLLGDTATDRRRPSQTFGVTYRRDNTMHRMCCVKRRDLLSNIYEENIPDRGETREKLFDGVRVIERWKEDDTNRWPKNRNPSILYYEPIRTFNIQSSGTYYVHSRIDFNCSDYRSFYNQTIHVRNDSHPNSFEDNRLDLSRAAPGYLRTIYTSSVDVMVELTKGEQLQMLTDPQGCTSPRSIVVYRLQDV